MTMGPMTGVEPLKLKLFLKMLEPVQVAT